MSHCTYTVVYIQTPHYCTWASKINCNFSLPNDCEICANNKYAPQMPQIWHMPKLLNMDLCGKYDNMYATYEVTPTNDVARIAVQKHHSSITYTELVTWTIQSKITTITLPILMCLKDFHHVLLVCLKDILTRNTCTSCFAPFPQCNNSIMS